jgi:hypothetical protein
MYVKNYMYVCEKLHVCTNVKKLLVCKKITCTYVKNTCTYVKNTCTYVKNTCMYLCKKLHACNQKQRTPLLSHRVKQKCLACLGWGANRRSFSLHWFFNSLPLM